MPRASSSTAATGRWFNLYDSRSKVERFLRLRPEILERFLRLYEETMPEATAAGRRLHRSGLLRAMSDERAPASEVLLRVGNEVASGA